MSILEERPLFVFCGVPLLVAHILVYILIDASQFLSLITANTLITHTYVWNMITCSFFEASPFKLIIDLGILWVSSSHIGKPNIEQFGLYFAFALLACSAGTSILRFLQFVGSGHEQALLVATNGFSGILQACLMYSRHSLRGQPLHPKLFPTITYHYAPTLYASIQIVFRIFGFRSIAQDLTFTIIGMVFSWSYLKFFYKYSDTEPAGDRSDDFTFVGMFPEVQQILTIFICFKILISSLSCLFFRLYIQYWFHSLPLFTI